MDWSSILKWNYSTTDFPVMWFVMFIVLAILFYNLLKYGKDSLLENILQGKILRCLIGVVFIIGFGLYTLGFNHDGSEGHFIAVIPRALLSSLQMFLSQSDLNDIDSFWKNNVLYVCIFSVTHFVATLITALLIIKMIGFRLRNWVRLRNAKNNLAEKECYVFWGMNPQSHTLAHNIKDKYKNDPNLVLIFVKSVVDDFGYGEPQSVGIERIFNVVSLRNADIKCVEELGAVYVNCDIDISDMEFPNKENIDVFEMLKLSKLGKIVRGCKKAHIFFLSDSESTNICSALNLMKDNVPQAKKDIIYCHARNEAINETFASYDKYKPDAKAELRIIDSSYLSVMQLKSKVEYNPVSFLTIDAEKAVVKKEKFTSLLIGLGESGLDALKFLYEFGALPTYDGDKVVKNDFHCCAIDAKMDQIEPQFYKNYPALKDKKDEVKLVNAKVGSDVYWSEIERLVADGLKYVVVALADDELAMSVTIDLYNYISRVRGNQFGKFKIFMRVHKMENEVRMNEFKDLYNNSNCGSEAEIVVLGCMEDIYSYDLIIENSIQVEADKYCARYNAVTKELKARAKKEEEEKPQQNKKEPQQNEEKEVKKLTFIDINNSNRKALQNISNSIHRKTKMALINSTITNDLLTVVKSRKSGSTIYPDANNKGVDVILRNLAIAEHMRWVASHEMLGYTKGDNDNHARKTHTCMVDWEDIKDAADGRTAEELKAYDCDVVDTTLELHNDENNNSKNSL